MNKKVPDWLNSSVWISNPSQRDRTSDLSSFTSTTADSDAPQLPITEPPLPVPPPSGAGCEEPPRSSPTTSNFQIKESESGDGEEGDQPARRTLSEDDVSRQSQLLAELSKKVVDMREVRRITAQGIPDGAGIRSTVWKLLLGYLPTDRSLWSSELIKKRSQYNNFKRELLINPLARCFWTLASVRRLLSAVALGVSKQQPVLLSGESEDGSYEGVGCFDSLYVLFLWTFCFNFCKILILEPNSRCFHGSQSEVVRKLDDSASCESDHSHRQSSGILLRSDITCGEHPLSLGKTSIWNRFFQDTEVVEQIDRDVKRTHPDMHFFSGDTPEAISNQDAVKTILILYAKLNPGIRYIQGMNEILAPLFYVFKNDPDADNADFVEADAFFCFVEILSGFRDNFCQQLDNSVGGIRSTIAKLSELLKDHDEELWRHLEITTKVNPQFYAFRWITLLLTQEFNFADSLQIWDFLLSDPEGPQETLLRVCCAMLILIRRRLLGGDFTSNLRLLQNYPSSNISHLLYVANKLRQKPSG